MERLDVNGLFWLVDKPDDKVAGRLRFDPTEGARLDLIGKFKDFVPSGHNPPVSMNAIAGGRLLTLAARIWTPPVKGPVHFFRIQLIWALATKLGCWVEARSFAAGPESLSDHLLLLGSLA